MYDASFNRHTGGGLVEDLRDEFDHLASNDDWAFVIGQLARAGISVQGEYASHYRQDPAADLDQRARIVAVPGTRIAYAFTHGAQQMHGPGTGYSYQWYLLQDPATSRNLDRPARIEGPSGPRAEFTAEIPGNHKVICKVERAGKKGVAPAFHEYPLTVVPEDERAADALAQAPEGQDPGRALAMSEAYLAVLREAEQQPGSAPLDPKTAAAHEKRIAAMKKRLASTEGAERIPIRAVHVDRETARVSPLCAFVSRVGTQGERETWRLVDITNPESRRLSGEYDGHGKDARRAILAALATWNERNRYPTGRIELEIDAEVAGEPIAHGFQTDGQSFWDSVAEFFAEVGFWAGMGALAAGVVTAVAPVPGSRAVSSLVWASILGSTVATGIEAAQRHAEDMSTARDDAMDALTIAGNILAGAWMRQARVLVNGQGGTRIGTGILIGQLASDSVQGIVLGVEHLTQYERILAIEDPEQRTRAMMELLRSAATAATLVVVSAQGAKSDLDQLGSLGQPGGHAASTRPGNQGGTIDIGLSPSSSTGADTASSHLTADGKSTGHHGVSGVARSSRARHDEARKVRGYYEDGTAAYEGDIKPDRLTMITSEAAWLPGHTELKMDMRHGRVYQRRIHAQTPEGEKLVIDIDYTNHGRGDHPAPHFHVYRYKNGSWTKKKSGIPSTGLHGEPSLNGHVYIGSQPWK